MGKYFYYGEGRYTPSAILKEKTITENGTYEPLQDGADGYDSVTVNVSGGGSSDFSTAEVTVVNNYEGSYINLPVCYEADALNLAGIGFAFLEDYATETFIVPLYKGGCTAQVTDGVNYSVSGNIIDDGGGWLFITGDGTITIS